jgi:hypothetical protein
MALSIVTEGIGTGNGYDGLWAYRPTRWLSAATVDLGYSRSEIRP